MNILLYLYPPQVAGMGHEFRCQALAEEAYNRDHKTITYYARDGETIHEIRERMESYSFCPDWIAVDVPGSPSDAVFELAADWGARVCLLNGIGYSQDDERADLTIVQGLGEGEYSGPQFVLLRPSLFTYLRWSADRVFVFGGARDGMGLLPKYQEACSDWASWLLFTEHTTSEPKDTVRHRVIDPRGESLFPYMAGSRRACVAMGMTVWELAVLRIPTFVFSISETHLAFAKRMEEAGHILAWEEVGVPEKRALRSFLSREYEPGGEIPDEKAAERVLDLMEKG